MGNDRTIIVMIMMMMIYKVVEMVVMKTLSRLTID
jgi:hypothetical protein